MLAALARMAEQAPFYIFTSFVFTYGTTVLAQPRNFLVTALLVASIGSGVWIPLFGHLSDRIGRRKTYLIGCVVTASSASCTSRCSTRGWPAFVFLGIFLSLVPHDILYGPQAALIAESFTPRLRYSGASIGYQLASVIAGGPAPLIATWLFARYHSGYAIAAFILFCAIVSFAAAWAMRDYTGADIHDEYDAAGRAPTRSPARTEPPLGGPRLREQLAQARLLDFAHRVARERVDRVEVLGHLEARQPLAQRRERGVGVEALRRSRRRRPESRRARGRAGRRPRRRGCRGCAAARPRPRSDRR